MYELRRKSGWVRGPPEGFCPGPGTWEFVLTQRNTIEYLRRSILVCQIFVGKNRRNGNGQKPIAAKITLRRTGSRESLHFFHFLHFRKKSGPKSIFVENEKWQESRRRFLSKKIENRKKKFSTKICDKIVDFCRFAMWRGGPVAWIAGSATSLRPLNTLRTHRSVARV